MPPVCEVARPPRGHLEAQAGPDHPRPGLCPPEPLSPAQPTPAWALWAGPRYLRVLIQDQSGEGVLSAAARRLPLRGAEKGHIWAWGEGPHVCPRAPPPRQDGLTLQESLRPVWGREGPGAGVGGRAAPLLHAGPRRHHYQAVLET